MLAEFGTIAGTAVFPGTGTLIGGVIGFSLGSTAMDVLLEMILGL
jgi:hypothetical protein